MFTIKRMLLLAALSFFSIGAFAQDEGLALSLKYAFDVEIDTDVGDVDGDGYGFNVGYGFGNGWSAELDVLSGEIDNSDVDIDAVGVYGVYRSSGEGYFLGKIGFANGEAEFAGFDVDDSALSYGVGGGFRFSDTFSLEGEYVMYDFDDADTTILAITGRFQIQ